MNFSGEVTTVQKIKTENDKGNKEVWKVTIQGKTTKAVITSESQLKYVIGENLTVKLDSNQKKLT